MTTRYALDKSNARLMGVCAGFAPWTDVEPALVRVTFALLALFLGPVAILAYLLTAFIADNG